MIDADAIENEVRATMAAIGEEHRGKGFPNAVWTQRLKLRLSEVAETKFSYISCATGCGDSEWLYDVTWLERNDDDRSLEDVPLVLESEWSRAGINYDFEKLLLARASVRVLVFEARYREESDTIIDDLVRRIGQFSPSRNGDRYLFAAWENAPKPEQFYFRPHVVKS